MECCCVRQEIEVKTLLEECTTASYSGESGSCKEEDKEGLELDKEFWEKETAEDALGNTQALEDSWDWEDKFISDLSTWGKEEFSDVKDRDDLELQEEPTNCVVILGTTRGGLEDNC